MSADDLLLPPEDPACLEPDPETMREMLAQVSQRVVRHLAELDSQPACGYTDARALCRELREPMPREGTPLEELLNGYFDEWVHRSFNTASPGYLAFVPGGGLFPSALADLISDSTNRYTGVWQGAPALVQLEANVLDWFREAMGFPTSARGLLTTGGSMANLSAVVCAREAKLGDDIRKGVVYSTDQVHHCVSKAAFLAGIRPDRMRVLPVDEQQRMRVAALADAVAADRAAGLTPFLVVSSAGTVNTGAVDPLPEVGAFCREQDLWHHVDGCYGGFFHLVPELRPLLAGLSEADSLSLDPHKGLFLPYGTGALLVRDGERLRAAHAATADYLPAPPDAEEFFCPSQYGPELSRDFRGLRVWLPFKLYGAARFEAAIAEKRQLAVEAAGRVAELPGVVMDAPPQLSLFAFHLTRAGADLAEEDRLTDALLTGVTARGRVMITGCTCDGRRMARVCVLSFRTRARQMEQAVQDITEVAAELLAG